VPVAAIDAFAKQTGKSKKDLEQYWKAAKQSAKNAGFSKDDDAFWAYAMGILKKRAGITSKSIKEVYITLSSNPEIRLRTIAEFSGDIDGTLLSWEHCKTQSLAWQHATNASNEQTMDYAFTILETVHNMPPKTVSEGIFGPDPMKKRKTIDKKIRKDGYWRGLFWRGF